MKHYLSVYKEFFKTSLAIATSYRLNFFLVVIMDLGFVLTTLAGVDFIFDHVQTIGPWGRDELLFFICFALTVDIFHMSFLSENFWMFSEDLKQGNLDFVLLKPVHAIFITFFKSIRASSFTNLILNWGILIYFGIQLGLTPLQWFFVPIFSIVSFALLAMVEITISCLMFWIIDGLGINFLRMQFQQLGRWPDFIYKKFFRLSFTFGVPMLLVNSAPVNILYGNDQAYYLSVYLIALTLSFIVMKRFWAFALEHYESASS